MSLFEIFALYLTLNLVILFWLTIKVIAFRMKHAVALGDGGQFELSKRVRAHGNLVETAPMFLLGLLGLAALAASPFWMHVIGALFTLGRVLHAVGMGRGDTSNAFRRVGTVFSLVSLLVLIIYLIVMLILGQGSYGIS